MKAIKINQLVNLNSGISIPAGSIVVIGEGYASVKDIKEGLIPAQVATFLFVSETAISEGKSPITDVADFNPVFSGLNLSLVNYQTKTAEELLISAVEDALVAIYGDENVEVITL
jgi:hypothetical protein